MVYRRKGPVLFLFILLSMFLLSFPVWAVENNFENKPYQPQVEASANPLQQEDDLSLFSLLLRFVISLAVVIAGALLVTRYVSRNLNRGGEREWIDLLDQYPLGPNKTITLVEIDGKVMVLGVTEQGISNLMEIGNRELIEKIKEQRNDDDVTRNGLVGILDALRKAVTGKATTTQNLNRKSLNFDSHLQRQIAKVKDLYDEVDGAGKDDFKQ